MGRDDHAVKSLWAMRADDGHTLVVAQDLEHRRPQPHPALKPRQDRLNIGARPAGDGAPFRLTADRQKPVIVKEPNKAGRREIHHAPRGRGPDRPRDRQQEQIAEIIAQPQLFQHVAKTKPAALIGHRLPEKAQDVAQHQQMARIHRPTRLREQRPRVSGAVFIAPAPETGGKGHVRRAGRHAQMIQQRHEQRIGPAIADDKAGIDRRLADLHRAGMAAGARLGLEQGHVMMRVQQPCRAKAGNAAADHGNFAARRGGTDGLHGDRHMRSPTGYENTRATRGK